MQAGPGASSWAQKLPCSSRGTLHTRSGSRGHIGALLLTARQGLDWGNSVCVFPLTRVLGAAKSYKCGQAGPGSAPEQKTMTNHCTVTSNPKRSQGHTPRANATTHPVPEPGQLYPTLMPPTTCGCCYYLSHSKGAGWRSRGLASLHIILKARSRCSASSPAAFCRCSKYSK